MARLCPYPMICTLHHPYDAEFSDLYRRSPQVKLVAISRAQARRETAPVAAVIHHGLDPNRYRPMPEQGYLLFLGRYDRVKGVTGAIEVAERAKLPLVMAGEPHDREYYDHCVRPLIEKHGVLELGPVGGTKKAALLARSRALLFPIEWEEPFGLVMIEAMLSGVPVLGHSRGAVPEVVDDGITGVICDDPTEMVAAARIADKLFNRDRIRMEAVRRWSSRRMAEEYLQLYRAAQAAQYAEGSADAEAAAEG
jgi:glycosyltransferase involved in cell wall biosynthesis